MMVNCSESSSAHEYSRLFRFKTDDDSSDSDLYELQVTIPEILHSQYGMYTWPSAVVLAQYLWHNRNQIEGRGVLEIHNSLLIWCWITFCLQYKTATLLGAFKATVSKLGAGTALPGIVAAKCGSQVTFSDSMWLPACLENCRRSCHANGLQDVTVLGITWGSFTPELLALTNLQYIIASDCFYDTKDFEDILVTVALLLELNPGSRFLCSYQIRCTNWTISDLLVKWNLVCTSIPLSSFGADGTHIAESNLPGRHTIQMLQIMPAPD